MVACPRCTFANTDDARVCKVCLCPLVEEQSAEEPTTGYSGVPCVACTFINPPGVGICGSCGTRNLTAAERAAAARAAKPVTSVLDEVKGIIDGIEEQFSHMVRLGYPSSGVSLPPVAACLSVMGGLHAKLAGLDSRLDSLEVDTTTRPLRKVQLQRVGKLVHAVEDGTAALKAAPPAATAADIITLITPFAVTT